MTDPQSGRSGAMDPGRSDGAAGAVQSSLDEDRREHTQEDPQSGTDAAAVPATRGWAPGSRPRTTGTLRRTPTPG